MSMFGHEELRAGAEKDHSPISPDLELFARVEGLVGEEAALLAIPRGERKREHRDRLREISAELDRIWETLQQRSKRLRAPHTHDSLDPSQTGGGNGSG